MTECAEAGAGRRGSRRPSAARSTSSAELPAAGRGAAAGPGRPRAGRRAAPHRHRRVVRPAVPGRPAPPRTRPAPTGARARVGAAAGAVRRLHALAGADCSAEVGEAASSPTGPRPCAGLPEELPLPLDRPRGPRADRARRHGPRSTSPAATGHGAARPVRRHRHQHVHGVPGRHRGAAAPARRRGRHPARRARSPAAPTTRSTTWSASSSTRWCCAPTCPATRRSPSCSAGSGRRPWPRSTTRTCRSSGWSRRSTRPGRRPQPAVPGHARLPPPARRRPRRARPADRVVRHGHRHGQVRPALHLRRRRRRARPDPARWSTPPTSSTGRRPPRLADRLVRPAGAGRRRTRTVPVGALDVLADEPSETAVLGRLERHRPRRAGHDPAGAVRARRRPGRRTRPPWSSGDAAADLRRAGRAGRRGSARRAGRARARARSAIGRGRAAALGRPGRRRCWRCTGPAPPTCRSTPTTRPTGWRSCSPTPARCACSPRRRCGDLPEGSTVADDPTSPPRVTTAGDRRPTRPAPPT